ncbi:MAG: hypothetical protein EOO43_11425 [Flavobacterium sp.]|nr:MAG: hypothetical protein EOO43_11425 [Flavobacterium sp.]
MSAQQQALDVSGYFMTTLKTFTFILTATFMWTSCRTQIKVKEEDKVFHAGPVNSGFGGIFFGLFKDNKYEFCDGDFMDAGCYTGLYNLSGDTIILLELRKHVGIPTNKFIIRRYSDMDSSYWIWKYPEHKTNWQSMRHNDTSMGSTGDIFPLDETNKIVYDRNNYFLIRLDSLQNNR